MTCRVVCLLITRTVFTSRRWTRRENVTTSGKLPYPAQKRAANERNNASTHLLPNVRVALGVAISTDAPLDMDQVLARPGDRVTREHIVYPRILQQEWGHCEGHHLVQGQQRFSLSGWELLLWRSWRGYGGIGIGIGQQQRQRCLCLCVMVTGRLMRPNVTMLYYTTSRRCNTHRPKAGWIWRAILHA